MLGDVDGLFKGTAVQKLLWVREGRRRSWLGLVVHRLQWNVLA